MLLPERARLVDTATAVARAVARAAVADKVAPQLTGEEIDQAIQRTRWTPAVLTAPKARAADWTAAPKGARRRLD